MRSRKIHRSIHEDARNVARQIATTPAYEQSCRGRKKVEMLFAHLKRILKLDKLRLRGFSGAAGIAKLTPFPVGPQRADPFPARSRLLIEISYTAGILSLLAH